MDKKIKTQIAGHDITLHFGNNYFYEFFDKEIGLDIATEGVVDPEKFDRFMRYTIGFIYCGHKAECAMNRNDAIHSLEDVRHWVMCMSMDDVKELFWQFLSKMSGKPVEEIKNVEPQEASSNGVAKVETEG